ncbi:MAG: DUF1015 family protein [Gammaproteobacteria bacterium]|nr:DUF1015 family protein [Gammaproteobacteria bacterium]
MTRIKAFDGYIVKAEWAQEIVSPAYDSVSPEQRRIFAETNPKNYLNTMRLLEDFPAEGRPTADELLHLNKSNLDRLLSGEYYRRFKQSCLFIYQLTTGDHVQTGLVCEVGIEEYEKGHMRKHENTRSDKETLLANYQKVVGVSSSPICLTYAQSDSIDRYIAKLVQSPPEIEFTSEDGVFQEVWRIESESAQQKLAGLFEPIEVTYLTDGHHRAASGQRYAEAMRTEHGNHGDEPYNQLLVALFPDNQLNLLPFHRCVRDSAGLDVNGIIRALSASFEVTEPEDPSSFQPSGHGEFGMFVNDTWYRLRVKPERVNSSDPVNSLDVTILQDLILGPILEIRDMRSDPRLDYIAGISGEEGIRQKCHEGWDVVFTCYATSIRQLMDIADADALMPPKSTYFDPKPRSGIFVRLK